MEREGPEASSRAPSEFQSSGGMPNHAESAPYYEISRTRLTCVEHPFKIQNQTKAVQSLGGSRSLSKIVSKDTLGTYEIPLYFHPGQRGSNSVLSGNVQTGNLLCQATVPKLTGRKRKRGSSAPFREPEDHDEAYQSKPLGADGMSMSERMLHGLRANAEPDRLKVVGIIERTHRFRTMLDFVYSVENNAFMSKVRKSILPLNYDAAKTFVLNPTRGPKQHADLIPPPIFSGQTIPSEYSYHQNPAVKQGIAQLGARKIVATYVSWDCPSVPTKPPEDLVALDSWEPAMQNMINRVKALLETRPVWTRRAIVNQVQIHSRLPGEMKHVYAYAGYEFVSGPWQNTIVRYGLDPRNDPACRVYQVMNFHLDDREKRLNHGAARSRRGARRTKDVTKKEPTSITSHIFDGESVNIADGKSWQVCDITDRVLRALLATTKIRKSCHIKTDGWYHNGTWAKAKTILKLKIQSLLGEDVGLGPADFAQVAALPEILDASTLPLLSLDGMDATKGAKMLASRVRAVVSRAETAGNEEFESGEESEAASPIDSGVFEAYS